MRVRVSQCGQAGDVVQQECIRALLGESNGHVGLGEGRVACRRRQ